MSGLDALIRIPVCKVKVLSFRGLNVFAFLLCRRTADPILHTLQGTMHGMLAFCLFCIIIIILINGFVLL